MRTLSLLLILCFVTFACVGLWAQKGTSDDELFDRVRLKLAADPDVKGGGIDVSVKDGVVTLRGKVEKEKQKSRAEHLTRKVKGVKSVVNQLVVGRR